MKSVALLSLEQTHQVRDVVLALRQHWGAVPGGQLHYLGCPSWLLGDADPALIVARNAILDQNLGWLYDLLAACLEQSEGPIEYGAYLPEGADPALFEGPRSYPGFHIFQAQGRKESCFLGTVHWDYRAHEQMTLWKPPLPRRLTPTRSLSFTLPISLPRQGSGLMVWPKATGHDLENLMKSGLDHVKAGKFLSCLREGHLEPYTLGTLYLHSGQLIHCAAGVENPEPDDERITLQGHALWRDGVWRVFW